jgi:predicted amidohydrolase YtcJ
VTNIRRYLRSLLFASVCSVTLACAPSESADITLINGNIYTLNPDQPKAEAIAIQGDRILFVGRSDVVKSYETSSTERIDLEGRTVVPGLTDSHVHLSGVGFRKLTLDLEGTTSLDEMIDRVSAKAADTPAGEWVTGRGWIEAQWDPPVFPTRHDLDRAAPEHPVWLTRADGHGAVANSKALEIAGIAQVTEDPPGGEIMRDAGGEPTGMLLDRAKNLVQKHIPGPTAERQREALVVGALGSKGAALVEDYADHSGAGLLLWKEDQLRPLYERALREGIQIQTHAIGDRANRMILDLYEEAFEKVPAAERKVADPRWRIEHAQVVHPDDIPRFAALKVIPSMQASHAITDFHFAKSRLGEERLKGAYAWKSMLNAGAIIAGSSDAPVEKGDPMVEFYAAIARKDLNGFSAEYWHPEEALKTLTIWPAYASFEEDD